MKEKHINLATQTLIVLSLVLLAANILLGTVLLNQSKEAMITLIHNRMLDISNTAAGMLDGDVLAVITAEDKDTPEYQEINDRLTVFQDNIDLKYIYCIRDMGNGEFTFTIDPTVDDPGEFGEPVVYTDALYRASQGTAAVDDEPYEDAWGRFYSSYSPVFDSQNKVAGIVAVDFSADWFDAQLSRQTRTILLSSLFSLCVGALIVLLITSRIRKRFRMLHGDLSELAGDVDALTHELAVASGSGDADTAAKAERNAAAPRAVDDINELGRRVRAMRGELREYIEQAHSQANSMITALSSDYRSVYYVDLDKDEGICYRAHSKLENGLRKSERFPFREVFTEYAQKYVSESYRQGFLDFIDAAAIRKGLEKEAIITYRYLVERNGKESYEMLRMAGVRHPEDRIDHIVHAVGAGFTDVDKETRDSMAQQQALSDALAAAEEANKAKTAFLSNMSHEIRTPMNAIIGLDSIALDSPSLSADTRDYLEKIGDSAHHLLGLINDILDMSRIESGQLVITNEEFSCAKLLEQINVIIDSQCQEKGLDYECEVLGELDDYYIGDDMKLKQVLINILGNAVKFTPAGGSVTLTVERTAHFKGKSTLCFIVKDTGIGMSSDFLPHIFDTFSQEDSSATNKYGSTGLGLAITKNIVEMMNGKIEVASEKGVGSTFTVTVTLMDSDRSNAAEDNGELRPQDMNVLVIDDDPVACQHARLELDKVGIASEAVLSGAEAVEMVRLRNARRHPYDLILVDWQMPEMDGVETARAIREIVGSDSAIIILTAYNWSDVLEEAVSAGVDSFIAKPLFAANVLEEFRSAIKKKHISPEQTEHKAELKGRRILLAEDVAVNAEIMRMLLQMREIEVDLAENGRLAVEAFAGHPVGYYDAILMDMRMPEMDGLTASAAIRAMDRPDATAIPIIALTANAFDEDVQRSLQAGLNAHLSKPVEPEDLFATLESLIPE